MILVQLYYDFIRNKIDKTVLCNFEDVTVLADRFLKHYHITVFEGKDIFDDMKIFMLIENIPNPILIELERAKNPKYPTYGKDSVRNFIPTDLYNTLASNGLFEKLKTAHNEHDSEFGIYRLQYCLYANILGNEIHHIDKQKKNNKLKNLVKMKLRFHRKVDNMPIPEGIRVSLAEQLKQRKEIFKPKKQTLARNAKLIVQILQLKENMSVSEVLEEIDNKLGKSSVYGILKFYFYSAEFVAELKAKRDKTFPPLDGNFKKRWENVLEFEEL